MEEMEGGGEDTTHPKKASCFIDVGCYKFPQRSERERPEALNNSTQFTEKLHQI